MIGGFAGYWRAKWTDGGSKIGSRGWQKWPERGGFEENRRHAKRGLNRETEVSGTKRRKSSQKELRNFKPGIDNWRRTKQRDQGATLNQPIVAEMTTTGFFVPLNQTFFEKKTVAWHSELMGEPKSRKDAKIEGKTNLCAARRKRRAVLLREKSRSENVKYFF